MQYYFSNIKKAYLTPLGWLDDNQLSDLEAEEISWKSSHLTYSHLQLLNIFPEAKFFIAKNIRQEIKVDKQILQKIKEVRRRITAKIATTPYQYAWFTKEILEQIVFADTLEAGEKASRRLKRNIFYLNQVNRHGLSEVKESGISEADIAAAKEIPIETFYTGKLQTKGGKSWGPCPFHNERTASFAIYKNQNSWFCYGCSCGGDVIDFVCKLHDLKFLDAVKKILNK